jgi:alcohol dehydrogenase class IV
MEENIRALQKRVQGDAIRRYEAVARILTADSNATPAQGVAWIAETCRKLNVPPLRTYGVSPDDVPVLIDKAANASSMKANAIALTADELRKVIGQAI